MDFKNVVLKEFINDLVLRYEQNLDSDSNEVTPEIDESILRRQEIKKDLEGIFNVVDITNIKKEDNRIEKSVETPHPVIVIEEKKPVIFNNDVEVILNKDSLFEFENVESILNDNRVQIIEPGVKLETLGKEETVEVITGTKEPEETFKIDEEVESILGGTGVQIIEPGVKLETLGKEEIVEVITGTKEPEETFKIDEDVESILGGTGVQIIEPCAELETLEKEEIVEEEKDTKDEEESFKIDEEVESILGGTEVQIIEPGVELETLEKEETVEVITGTKEPEETFKIDEDVESILGGTEVQVLEPSAKLEESKANEDIEEDLSNQIDENDDKEIDVFDIDAINNEDEEPKKEAKRAKFYKKGINKYANIIEYVDGKYCFIDNDSEYWEIDEERRNILTALALSYYAIDCGDFPKMLIHAMLFVNQELLDMTYSKLGSDTLSNLNIIVAKMGNVNNIEYEWYLEDRTKLTKLVSNSFIISLISSYNLWEYKIDEEKPKRKYKKRKSKTKLKEKTETEEEHVDSLEDTKPNELGKIEVFEKQEENEKDVEFSMLSKEELRSLLESNKEEEE